jgi:hypothetical protein
VTQATLNSIVETEIDKDDNDPVFIAECVGESSREFALDLAHHLNWLRWRSEGADLTEVARLRAQLDTYVRSRFAVPMRG